MAKPLRRGEKEAMPGDRRGVNHDIRIAGESLNITVGFYPDGRVGEVFAYSRQQGTHEHGLWDALTLVISLALQYGTPLAAICEKLRYQNFPPQGMTRNPEIPAAASPVDYLAAYLPGLERRVQQPIADTESSGEAVTSPAASR